MPKKAKYYYTSGNIVPVNYNNASSMMHAVNYGTAAFEGMKAFYNSKDKCWRLFRPDQHLNRLKASSAKIDIPLKLTLKSFVDIITQLIKKNNLRQDLYIRPLAFKSTPGVGLMKKSDYDMSIFIVPHTIKAPRIISTCSVSQKRPTDGSFNVKLSGNYLLSYFAQKEALAQKRDLGIMLSTDGYLSEATVMNLFFIKNDKIFTPSVACGALDGITRRSVIEIITKVLKQRVYEGKYRPGRLANADSAFLTGTGSGINVVSRFDKTNFSTAKSKHIAYELFEIYRQIAQGQIDQFKDWLTIIE